MKALLRITLLFCFLFFSFGSFSQFNPAKMAADKINQRAEKKTGEAIDKSLDEMEKDIKGENDEDNQNDEESDEAQADGQDEGENIKSSSQQEQTPLQAYSKFDFIPGEKVIFFDDFSQDAVGDFPALWNTNGSG